MNPYHPPEAKQPSEKKPLNNELREIVIGWERLRVLYNVILLVVGIGAIFLLMRSPYFHLSEAILPSIGFGLFANICFCSGPTVETYIRAIFNTQDIRSLRLILFVLGTLFSLIPACFAVLAPSSNFSSGF